MIEEEAIALAKRIADENGWSWLEPVRALHRGGSLPTARWEVTSNANCRGCNVKVVIDAGSGNVIEKRFLPR